MDITEWLAIGIAALALWTSYRLVSITHTHNKLSVRPLVRVRGFYDKYEMIRYEVENIGHGPAEITDCHLIVDGERYIRISNKEAIDPILQELELDNDTVQVFFLGGQTGENYHLSPGESVCVISFPATAEDHSINRRIHSIVTKRTGLHVDFRSLYLEEDEAETHVFDTLTSHQ